MPDVIPETPEQIAEWVGGYDDPAALNAAIADGSFGRTLTDIVKAAQEGRGEQFAEIQRAAAAEAQKVLATALGAQHARRLNLSPSGRGGPQIPGGKRAIGSGVDGVFADFTEFAQSIHMTGEGRTPSADQRDKLGKLFAYQEKVPSDGGFLVPEEFRTEILRVALERAVVRPRARVIPMNGAKLSFPAVDESSHVSTVMGGVLAYRTEEGAALVESGASFKKITLDLTKQTLYSVVTNELIMDTGGAIDGFVRESFGMAAAWFEDVDFLTGNGVGMPIGALAPQNQGTVVTTAVSGQGAGTLVWENIVAMYARMLPSSLGSAVWVIGPDVFPQLATMGLVVGTGGGPVWLPDGTGAPTMTLLGRPIIISEKVPAALGTQGDISFVDFGYYLIGDGMRMRIESSPHFKFGNDQTAYRLVQRNDGRPWLTQPLTPKNGSATLSPFVQLSSTRT